MIGLGFYCGLGGVVGEEEWFIYSGWKDKSQIKIYS